MSLPRSKSAEIVRVTRVSHKDSNNPTAINMSTINKNVNDICNNTLKPPRIMLIKCCLNRYSDSVIEFDCKYSLFKNYDMKKNV